MATIEPNIHCLRQLAEECADGDSVKMQRGNEQFAVSVRRIDPEEDDG